MTPTTSFLRAGIAPETVTVLCDRAVVAAATSAAGWPDVRDLARYEAWSAHPITAAVLLRTDPVAFTDPRLHDALGHAEIVDVPLHVFDPNESIAVYTLKQLRQTSFTAAIARNRRWVRVMEREPVLRFTGARRRPIDLACTPAEEIKVTTAVDLTLAPGVVKPIGLYFEVELERDAAGARPFTVDGTLHIDGIVHAVGEDFSGDEVSARSVADRILRAAQPDGLTLEIRGNVVVACRAADGRSLLPELAEVAGGDLALSEFAIGTNRVARPDFSLNAQVNEGAGGIHVGVGGGPGAVHVDFVALAARRVAA